ncbi:MAG: cyclase family protein, partial [Kiritimatiellia bacterium]|nr:cyclase family protein [Kiritimatiellia bacterium]
MRLDEGAESNCSRVTLFNHCGTHIDAPNHFVPGGRTLADLAIDEFIFERPVIVEVPLSDEELVTRRHLEEQSAAMADCDLLMIRSGFSRHRSTDLERYTWSTPGVSAEAATYIVEEFANVRAVGVDFLSFETLRDMSHGFQAHRIVLGKGVVIIEDLNL